MRAHLGRDNDCFSAVMIMHYINFIVLIFGFTFQLVIMILPFLYFMILFSNFTQFLVLKYLSHCILTSRNQIELQSRKGVLCYMWGVFIVTFIIGFIPVQGFGPFCSEEIRYPICFSLLVLNLFFYQFSVRKTFKDIDAANS